MKDMRVTIILHNIRSAQNVGAIFRTADAAGAEDVILTGYTPAPLDRFQRRNSRIEKTALGAEQSVPWRHVSDIHEVLAQLKKDGVHIVAVEQDSRAKDYKEMTAKGPLALILGNEVEGIPSNVCQKADEIVRIPMRGEKESLNVSVAAGIIAYYVLDQSRE